MTPSPTIDYVGLGPELVMVATAVAILLLDLFIPNKRPLSIVAFCGATGALAWTVGLLVAQHTSASLGGAYVVDNFALLGKVAVLVGASAVLAMGLPRHWKGEYLVLVLAATIGMTLIVSARDLVTYVVAFELLAIPAYLLTAWNKERREGHEAAVKYYLLGVLSSAVMLYGASLIFGLVGSTRFDVIGEQLASSPSVAVAIAVVLVLVGLGFKVSLMPFHFWAPDAYQGAPIPVAAFLAVASKAAALLAVASLLLGPMSGVSATWGPVLAGLCGVTMVAASLIALRQQSLMRLLAYSSVAQTGFALVPVAVVGQLGGQQAPALNALYVFIVVLVVSKLAVFAAVAEIIRVQGTDQLPALAGVFRQRPVVGVVFSVGMLSLAGVPPLAGWFAKLVVVQAAIESSSVGGWILVGATVLATVIGLVFYARAVAIGWSSPAEAVDAVGTETEKSSAPVMGMVCCAFVVAIGVLPALVTELAEQFRF